ncbi:MAG: toll/interleukin-1 receptor domain-containing protein [Acidobacteria bacterium]|nr:toll/interleukin-1 receptor domain-containing protein [Acidobacteriota bacterium]
MGGAAATLMPATAAIVHSAADQSAAGQVAAMLTNSLGYQVDTRKGLLAGGQSFLHAMDAPTWHADLTVVLLRSESVPPVWVAEEWQPVLWGEEGGVLVCGLQTAPGRVVARGRGHGYCYIDGQQGMQEALVALRRWVIETRSADRERRFDPAPVAPTGRTSELRAAADALVERSGLLVVTGDGPYGKTHFAQEFARAHVKDFDDMLWVSCRGRQAEDITAEVSRWQCPDRGLLILDDGDPAQAPGMTSNPLVSCLVTTRTLEPPYPSLILSSDGPPMPLDAETANLLTICRPDWIIPALAKAIGLDESATVPLDLNTGVRRAPGWVHDLSPEPAVREMRELRYAEALLRVLTEGAGPEVLVDVVIALRQFAEIETKKSLFAMMARRGEQLCRSCGDVRVREQVLRIATEAAWNQRDEILMGRFVPDLTTLLDDLGRAQEAESWRRRWKEAETRQLSLPFENSQDISGHG